MDFTKYSTHITMNHKEIDVNVIMDLIKFIFLFDDRFCVSLLI